MYCDKLFESLDKRLEERKSIDDIVVELCPTVSKGREKIVRLIKIHRGGDYLIKNHDWLGYSVKHIRNRDGNGNGNGDESSIVITADNRLFKPSLNTRIPEKDEYLKWIDSLNKICDILTKLDQEMTNTTEGRHIWKVNNLIKKTKELKMILSNVNR